FSFIKLSSSFFSNIGKESTSVGLSMFLYCLFNFSISSGFVKVTLIYKLVLSNFSFLKHSSTTCLIVLSYFCFFSKFLYIISQFSFIPNSFYFYTASCFTFSSLFSFAILVYFPSVTYISEEHT